MADKIMYISNDDIEISFSVVCNEWMKRLDTKLDKPTNKNSIKDTKVLNKRIKKRYYKTLGTSLITSPMTPSSLLMNRKE